MSFKQDTEYARRTWESISEFHPRLRKEQNRLASEILGQQVELRPARIVFGWWNHLFNGDYMILVHRTSDKIGIDSCYVRDYNEKSRGETTFEAYVLDRVAHAEGTRTANECWDGRNLMGYEEPAGMCYVGDWLRFHSLKAVGRWASPLKNEVEATLWQDKEKLKRALVSPSAAYFMIEDAVRGAAGT
jgi:hypothetical protein